MIGDPYNFVRYYLDTRTLIYFNSTYYKVFILDTSNSYSLKVDLRIISTHYIDKLIILNVHPPLITHI